MDAEQTPSTLPPATLAAFAGDELRARIFLDKYALRDETGTLLEQTPEQMWRRVARELARTEAPENRAIWAERFYWLLSDWRVVPGGRVLHALGNVNPVTALNCYVVPSPTDSIQGIYHTAWELAETFKRGGGCGVDISSLRPAGAPVRNAARTSTGAVSFMELYSLTTGLIGQGGRRGALMITLRDSHPDIVQFCRVKRNLERVRYANISVRVSDAFMRAVLADEEWLLHYESPADRLEIRRVIPARQLWRELIRGARDWAEPGCLFWDTIQRFSASDRYPDMAVVSTNPCGEEPLEPYGECCLGSVNLSAFVRDPFTPAATLDLPALEQATRWAVRFLDDVLTWNRGHHPLPQQEEAAERGRRIGVGLMGLADMLCQLQLRYDTDEAIEKAAAVVEAMKLWAYDESVALAVEKGPFPLFDSTRHLDNPFFHTFPPSLTDRIRQHGLRNVTLLTVPPTGTIAALAGCTSGIEPIFALTYTRRSESLSQAEFHVTHPLVARYRDRDHGSPSAELPEYFVTAHTIDAEKRVLMQAAIQRHIDQALSSTINLPADTTAETVERLYRQAWEAGCKGITVYRAGARENILTATGERSLHLVTSRGETGIAPRPPILPGVTIREETPLGTAFVTINYDGRLQEPFEAFLRLGKAGSDLEADAEALGRLISLILRLPSPMSRLERIEEIIGQLEMIGGARTIGFGPSRVRSVPDGIARALSRYVGLARPGAPAGVARPECSTDQTGVLGPLFPPVEA
ncbi:MAG: adenosylcobalamin-dependent ribonucleoside-diphosphate reductase, partial [Candidatus Binatia bacterium]|nr:adenosylcobalamin-dependent ribonucleoside-diphosphate reductase [Candidatus Binatia bacterium]